ncbi:hypothetical protein [Pontibacter anaerobius]|uniref:Uncharacterized protein n=1 Tax=Pontibacter anaerobius TaxID=2993940 RepID=A0ABT3RJL0_9BACT|nr:hypothetical protein [Pontibacter anaerobius]MCX2741989.1 hypothetical protein [Pontibacter anaerobius]
MASLFTPTTGLDQLANIISKERGVLQEYAAKPTANQELVNTRDRFLQSLASAYNQVYAEMAATKRLLHTDRWLLVEEQIRQLQEGELLDGIHIKLTLGNGNRYGLISL